MSAALLGAIIGSQFSVPANCDLADPANRGVWLHHPVIGDPSFDRFIPHRGNPIYTGLPPWEWPVNGFLFRDPATDLMYCCVSMYPVGYWPAGPTRLLRSVDGGETWEDAGLVLEGNEAAFDRGGATCDATIVMDGDGCHAAYGWATPDNTDGGLAYAFADRPEGPWLRDAAPIHAESAQPVLPPRYKRVYAGTLIRRASDWLVLAAMSTPGNAGGMWALICMTAPEASGPYSSPRFIRRPQDAIWLPQPIEFGAAFVCDSVVYAMLSSVAANRTYQLVLSAPLEQAHEPDAWSVEQDGSAFHWEGTEHDAHGIWGQAYSGFVDDAGMLRVMYPARNSRGAGTVNLASRPWAQPHGQGFWVSAPNAPSLALALRSWSDVSLKLEARSSGPWRLVWNHRAPLGPDRSSADAVISPATLTDMAYVRFAEGSWSVAAVAADGTERQLGSGPLRSSRPVASVELRQRSGRVRIAFNRRLVWEGELGESVGALGLMAERGTALRVERLLVTPPGEPAARFLLPLEGLIGTGADAAAWEHRTEGFLYGTGYAGPTGALAKWSFVGTLARLWLPRGPEYGVCQIRVDGRRRGRLDLGSRQPEPSAPVWAVRLPEGRHAIQLECVSGLMPVDCLEVWP